MAIREKNKIKQLLIRGQEIAQISILWPQINNCFICFSSNCHSGAPYKTAGTKKFWNQRASEDKKGQLRLVDANFDLNSTFKQQFCVITTTRVVMRTIKTTLPTICACCKIVTALNASRCLLTTGDDRQHKPHCYATVSPLFLFLFVRTFIRPPKNKRKSLDRVSEWMT